MADSVNLSTWWLCHLFREHLDTSPDRLLTQVRMKKARELLENSFLTVKEVRTEVGIRDASSFTRGFKAEFGVTPANVESELTSDEHQTKAAERCEKEAPQKEDGTDYLSRSKAVLDDPNPVLAVGSRGHDCEDRRSSVDWLVRPRP